MKNLISVFTCALLAFLAMSGRALATFTTAAPHVSGEVIVHFKSTTTQSSRHRSLARRAHVKLADLGAPHILHVKLGAQESVRSALQFYENDPDVEFVQPNYIYTIKAFTRPTDPLYAQQWAFRNTGQTILSANGPDAPDATNGQPNGGTSGDDMSMEGAWAISTDCSPVIVAVVDTGVNYNHEDLAGNMWTGLALHGKNFVGTGPGGSADPMDQAGHGTHVAGIIAAQANNGKGGVGVCWTAQIMAVRVLDATGSGTTVDIANGVNFAVANRVKVINMSLGGPVFDQTFSDAITAAYSAGVVVVVAAGNSALNVDTNAPSYPCNFNQANIICVAALNQSNGLAYYSNFGATSVDVGAPGSNIVSTWVGTESTTTDNLSAGWTMAGGWGYTTANLGTIYNLIANPANFDYTQSLGHNFTLNADDRIYKNFNLAGATVATAAYYSELALTSATNFVNVNYKSTGGDPFTGGVQVGTFSSTDNTGLAFYRQDFNITPCISATCAVGFRLISDGARVASGVGILLFSVTKLTTDSIHYNVIEGTSMASPYVAGLAALVASYNPSESVDQLVNTIKKSGVGLLSLSEITTTGKAVNGWDAMTYIAPPVITSHLVQ
ncbi:MAG: S8 family serine peptidase [Deltaproteobacteria bacterium]|nr:S8 family serine peptidase [Deltaproteobacteria bacterium]